MIDKKQYAERHYMAILEGIDDDRGKLTVITPNENIPFEIKRLFYISDVECVEERGNHANINSSFIMIALQGSCEVVVDDGVSVRNYLLNDQRTYLYMSKMIWKTMKNFTQNCILLVLSDCVYDRNEYVTEYDVFKKLCMEDKALGNTF